MVTSLFNSASSNAYDMHTLNRKGELLDLQLIKLLEPEFILPLPTPEILNCFDKAMLPRGPMRTWGISLIVTVFDWKVPWVLALPTAVEFSRFPKGPFNPNTFERTPRLRDVEVVSALKLPDVVVLIVGS